jgi:16S rRNA (guanine966-N2)-methyltransferase
VLDAFCGSGALALEALSRGAASAALMDIAAPSLALARRNAETLGLGGQCSFIRASATEPPATSQPADLIFLDPPYHKGLIEAALPALTRQGWAAPAAVALCETASDETLSLAGLGWRLVDRRKYGATTLWIVALAGNAAG